MIEWTDRVANAVLQPLLSSADAATLDAWVETLALRAAVGVVVILNKQAQDMGWTGAWLDLRRNV